MNGDVREYAAADFESVAALYTVAFGEQARNRWVKRFDWEFRDNPAATGAPLHMWVVEKSGTILGFLAALPARVKLNDTTCVAHYPCDLMVAPEARGQGLGQRLWLAYLSATDTLSTVPAYAPATGRLCTRLGYRPVDAAPYYARPYDVRPTLRRKLAASPLGPTAALLAGGIGWGLNGLAAVRNRLGKPRVRPDYVVTRAASAGSEFDRLWQTVAPLIPALAVRDRAFVQWRFFDDPVFEHTVLVARDRTDAIAGYCDLTVTDKGYMTVGRIMDVFAPPAAVDLVATLLRSALEHLEHRRVAAVSSLGLCPGIRAVVRRPLYLRASATAHPAMLLWKGAPAMAPLVYDASNWHFSFADGDEGFSP
jgi:GNAT superfamily N-acetyltransferase